MRKFALHARSSWCLSPHFEGHAWRRRFEGLHVCSLTSSALFVGSQDVVARLRTSVAPSPRTVSTPVYLSLYQKYTVTLMYMYMFVRFPDEYFSFYQCGGCGLSPFLAVFLPRLPVYCGVVCGAPRMVMMMVPGVLFLFVLT